MPRKNVENDGDRISRSTKLRKYASVYKSYVRKTEQSKISKSPRRERKYHKTTRTGLVLGANPVRQTRARRETTDGRAVPDKPSKEVTKSKKKSLNSYQKFVRLESKKDKYKELPGKQRLSAIASEWKKINN